MNAKTKQSSANLYAIPEGICVYAIGDIHGRIDLLQQLHDLILHDKVTRTATHFLLIYLGDYVDRGEHSREVIESLIHQPLVGFEIIHLCGNHEHAMLQFIESEGKNLAWLQWGGMATLASYGVPLWHSSGKSHEALHLAHLLASALPTTHQQWLQSLPYYTFCGDYLFAHAGINPKKTIEKQSPEDYMMVRDTFFNYTGKFNHAIVFGHTVFDTPLLLPDRIGIDTGAYATGHLTALVLEGTQRDFIST